MNTPAESTSAAPMRWYRVGEVWLMLVLLGATVAGSLSLVATALRHPDAHIVVPDDTPRPGHQPPARPSAAATRRR